MKIVIDFTKKEIASTATIVNEMGLTSNPDQDVEQVMSTNCLIKNNLISVDNIGPHVAIEVNEELLCNNILSKLLPIAGICKVVYGMLKTFISDLMEDIGETEIIDRNATRSDFEPGVIN